MELQVNTFYNKSIFLFFEGQNMVSESSIQIQTSGEGEVDDRTFSKQPGKETADQELFTCYVIVLSANGAILNRINHFHIILQNSHLKTLQEG